MAGVVSGSAAAGCCMYTHVRQRAGRAHVCLSQGATSQAVGAHSPVRRSPPHGQISRRLSRQRAGHIRWHQDEGGQRRKPGQAHIQADEPACRACVRWAVSSQGGMRRTAGREAQLGLGCAAPPPNACASHRWSCWARRRAPSRWRRPPAARQRRKRSSAWRRAAAATTAAATTVEPRRPSLLVADQPRALTALRAGPAARAYERPLRQRARRGTPALPVLTSNAEAHWYTNNACAGALRSLDRQTSPPLGQLPAHGGVLCQHA